MTDTLGYKVGEANTAVALGSPGEEVAERARRLTAGGVDGKLLRGATKTDSSQKENVQNATNATTTALAPAAGTLSRKKKEGKQRKSKILAPPSLEVRQKQMKALAERKLRESKQQYEDNKKHTTAEADRVLDHTDQRADESDAKADGRHSESEANADRRQKESDAKAEQQTAELREEVSTIRKQLQVLIEDKSSLGSPAKILFGAAGVPPTDCGVPKVVPAGAASSVNSVSTNKTGKSTMDSTFAFARNALRSAITPMKNNLFGAAGVPPTDGGVPKVVPAGAASSANSVSTNKTEGLTLESTMDSTTLDSTFAFGGEGDGTSEAWSKDSVEAADKSAGAVPKPKYEALEQKYQRKALEAKDAKDQLNAITEPERQKAVREASPAPLPMSDRNKQLADKWNDEKKLRRRRDQRDRRSSMARK